MAATVKYRYWLGIKSKEKESEVLPFDEEGFTKEQALKARVELVKGGLDNNRIVTIITIEDEECP